MATWNKIQKLTESGIIVEMPAPTIISASRSTDIPAFYSDWFFKRLELGYSTWTNPFNGVPSYVAYDLVRFIVFWSKNPEPLFKYFPILEQRNIKCYIQFTLNDYKGLGEKEEELERRIPPVEKRIDTFKRLVAYLGKGAVVWRFDPLILTDNISIDTLLEKIAYIGDQLKNDTEKLVFSYADIGIYRKVKHNMDKSGIPYHEWTDELKITFAEKLSALNRQKGWNFELATCTEGIDLSNYGIAHNRCVDADLITRLAYTDKTLMDFMGVKIETIPMQMDLFSGEPAMPEGAILLPNNLYFISKHKKDKGQRQYCDCMVSKDIGEYNTCPFRCEYCYANTSKELAAENYKRHKENPNAETITGR
jgi:hypothetical protein